MARREMLILNPPFSDEKFFEVEQFDDIKKSDPGTILFFREFKPHYLQLFSFCKKNDLAYGVWVKNLKEFIFIANLKAKYAFTDNLELAKRIQEVAETYLLGTKVILIVDSLEKIERPAELGIDGVIKIRDGKIWRWREK